MAFPNVQYLAFDVSLVLACKHAITKLPFNVLGKSLVNRAFALGMIAWVV